ncbi:MAG: hypothetical protein AW10_04253 [Candidatus Accumulibacter appositus]|uniref:Uncharacterized protein n=1 Tax=Candidatus Accumulibacter appositus TaxID=1454003 RepID=A0A011P6J0_9PROT|nr:MAG: hypothetical protein AW10_04253 [Candidatus Accumulibacter appositus]
MTMVKRAGIIAPRNILPTEFWVVAANMIIGILGGIRIPSAPPAMITPRASCRLYPRSSIGFSAILPEVMIPAPMIPTIAPIIEQTPITLIASEPRTLPMTI